MAQLRVSYAPPTGYPLGTNRSFKVGAAILIPIIRLITKRTWIGGENSPKSGAVIVANNHLSYFDVLNFAHFLFKNGRAPRFLGKVGVFRVPLIGRFLLAAGQVPVERETPNAGKAVDHAKKLLESGHLLGVYPEGTLSRDLDHWPMVAKTGLARLALTTNTPVIPVAQWGAQILMPTYSKKIKLFPRTQITIVAGKPVDLSPWYGKGEDQQALIEATAKIMEEITTLLEGIRGEKRPEVIFDPHTSDLPRIGNFKKKKR
jgi:1-acyl-sn-glycerol-3-phosphate acyltransferase